MARDYRLVVFDWDGTLMDSIATIVACTRAALVDLGVEPGEEALLRRAIGLGLPDVVATLLPDRDPSLHVALAERYRAHWLATYKDEPELFPSSREVVATLRGAGYRVGVATAKSRRGLERELERSGLGALLDATRTVDEAPAKPDPGMLLGLMAELGAAPGETLMVGDTRWDLLMAERAGVDAVAVCSGSHPREELLAAAPLACLGGVAELPGWLGVGVPPSADAPR